MAKRYKYALAALLLTALCLLPALSFAQTETPQDSPAETESYRGDVVQFTGNITIQSDEIIKGNVVAMSGNIDIAGKVYGDVTAMAGNIKLRSGSVVSGNVTTMAGLVEQEDGASIEGEITRRDLFPYNHQYSFHYPRPWVGFAGWLLTLIGLLALTAVAVAVFPGKLKTMKNSMEAEPFRLLGIGLLGWVALPVLLLALTIMIIGIPVAFLLLLCLPILIIIGFVIMALFTGQQLDKALGDRWPRLLDERPIIQALKGIALIWIIKAVPLVGWIVWPLAALFGMGAALATRFGTNRPWFKGKNGAHSTVPNAVDPGQANESAQPDNAEKQPPGEAAESREVHNSENEE